MTSTSRAKQRGVRRGPRLLGLTVVIVAVAAALAVLVGAGRGGSDQPTVQSETATAGPAAAQVHGLEVDRASVDAGRVPLNTPVRQEFRLRNTGGETVALGRARVEVLEGC